MQISNNQNNEKKLIVYPAGLWAKELLTLSRFEKIEYFIDDEYQQGKEFEICGHVKKIFPFEKIVEEKINDIIVLISDTKKYQECKQKLENIGLIENIHFFNGWKLHKNFYSYSVDEKDWLQYEKNKNINHDEQTVWEERAREMSSLIPEDVKSLMDIGCGNCRLKKYLPDNMRYYGLDCVKREEDTLLCDINAEQLPKIQVDMYYLAGVLYYVNDIKKLFEQMKSAKYIIFNYFDEMNQLRLDGYCGGVPSHAINEREEYITIADIINTLWDCGFVVEKVLFDYRERNNYYFRAKNRRLV